MAPTRVYSIGNAGWKGLKTLTQSAFALFSLLVVMMILATSAHAQTTAPPTINAGNPTLVNNIGGTTSNTQNFGSLGGLGLNQGETFTFTGQPTGGALWNGGFNFLDTQVLQFQADASGLPANPVQYELNFTDAVYGLQFRMSGLDNADETIITFFRDNVPVPVTVSTFVNGGVTVPRAGNIISFAGTNIDIDPNGNGFRADGDNNNDAGAGSIGIHGIEEGFVVNLPLGVAVDEVRLSSTGKNNGTGGNVTLILTDFAWARPNIAVTKLDSFSDGGNGQSNVGDIITYTYTVTNNGNVPLSSVTLDETGFGGSGTAPIPSFTIGTGGATPASLPPGETLTYTASYSVTADDLVAGFVDNQATVSALPGNDVAGQEITDLSDSENPGDGGTQGSLDEDDSNRTEFTSPIVFNPAIEAVKTADVSGISNPAQVGETIDYTIVISNTGDVDLINVTLADTLTNADGTSSNPAPAFVTSSAGSPNGSLAAGENATYEFSYAITQGDIDSRSISNTVTANATTQLGLPVSDISDDGNDLDGNTVDDPTVSLLPVSPSISITKVADDTTNVAAGQTITYTYRIENTGNQTISNISLVDVHNGNGPAPVPANEILDVDNSPASDSSDATANDGVWSTLAPGDIVLFTANYTVLQQDLDTLQ